MVEQVSQVPLLFPITIEVEASETKTISFPNEYLGFAVNVLVQNESGGGSASVQIGGSSQPTMTIPTSEFRTWENTNIKLLKITAHSGGSVIVQAQLQHNLGVAQQQ